MAIAAPRLVRSLVLFGPVLCPPDSARPAIRARGEKARAEGDAGRQAVADALVQEAISTEARTRRPVAGAAVRALGMPRRPHGCARTTDRRADSHAGDAGAISRRMLRG